MLISATKSGGSTGYQTDVSIIAGETVALAANLSLNGSPVNLTGYSLKMQINFQTPELLNTGNGGITITNAAQGAIQINMSSTLTAAFPRGSYPYDLWMVSGGGVETPLLTGNFSIAPSISPVP